MNPKDKARELVIFYIEESVNSNLLTTRGYDIKCALFCVNKILESLWYVGHSSVNEEIKYYEEVKQEINKLL
tara:strand:- start:820 stop:1035 length:216 start_codon:yes stop_codon:yes gene_type:complete